MKPVHNNLALNYLNKLVVTWAWHIQRESR